MHFPVLYPSSQFLPRRPKPTSHREGQCKAVLMASAWITQRALERLEDLYECKKVLGEGCFGCVWHCLNRETRLECAVKQLPVGASEEAFLRVQTEVEILASLSHPNIVQFQGAVQIKDTVYLQMELLQGGSLKSLLSHRRLEDREAAALMQSLLRAVSYIHSKNIYHQDLKPENILLSQQDCLDSIKITDFGLSLKFEGSDVVDRLTDLCGTLIFMAPEQGRRFFYSKAVDIWSCALILYMSLTGSHPLYESGDTTESYLAKLKQPNWTFPAYFNPQAKSLFLKMTALEPIERYSAEQALRHPFICRSSTEIPRTCLEQLIEFADIEKMRRIAFALLFLAGNLLKQGIEIVPSPANQPRISLQVCESLPSQAAKPRFSLETVPKPKGALGSQKKAATLSHLNLSYTRNSYLKGESLTPGALREAASPGKKEAVTPGKGKGKALPRFK